MTVAWFSSSGDTELGGEGRTLPLQVFLDRFLPDAVRWFPAVSKPGPKLGRRSPRAEWRGYTGSRLVREVCRILEQQQDALDSVRTVVIIDDADCRFCDDDEDSQRFREWCDDVEKRVREAAVRPELEVVVLLASPEIEAWLILDWENTFGSLYGRQSHVLARTIRKPFLEKREAFGCPEKAGGGCTTKLRRLVEGAVIDLGTNARYRPAIEGCQMLAMADPQRVAERARVFFRPGYLRLRAM